MKKDSKNNTRGKLDLQAEIVAFFKSLPPFLHPRLRIFLSADIAGSTAAKQKESSFYRDLRSEDTTEERTLQNAYESFFSYAKNKEATQRSETDRQDKSWIDATTYFYEAFHSKLRSNWEEIANAAAKSGQGRCGPEPVYWKSIGDEILFFKELTSWEEIWPCLVVWIMTLKQIRAELRNRYRRLALDVKGTAWLADFPVVNTEFVLNAEPPSNAKAVGDFPIVKNLALLNQYYEELAQSREKKRTNGGNQYFGERDFIGPLIDIGFRLAGLAVAGKIVVSVDLAFAMSATTDKAEIKENLALGSQQQYPKRKFYYAGRKHLKGVAGSSGYPVFYLDMDLHPDDLFSKEGALLGAIGQHVSNETDIMEFCKKFYDDSPFFWRPYIFDKNSLYLLPKSVPALPHPGHLERLRALSDMWEKYRIEIAGRRLQDSFSQGLEAAVLMKPRKPLRRAVDRGAVDRVIEEFKSVSNRTAGSKSRKR